MKRIEWITFNENLLYVRGIKTKLIRPMGTCTSPGSRAPDLPIYTPLVVWFNIDKIIIGYCDYGKTR